MFNRLEQGTAVLTMILAAVALASNISDATGNDLFRVTPRLIEEFGRTHGYCVVQDAWLDYTGKAHPDLQASAVIARAEFNLAYGGSCAFVEETLAGLANVDRSVLRKQMLTQLQEESPTVLPGGALPNRDLVKAFLDDVVQRARGEIASPVLEILLATSADVRRNPAYEISRRVTKVFSTSGHSKSRGLQAQLRLPQSWLQKEGDRPHIVQKWLEANGHGYGQIMLIATEPEVGFGKEFLNSVGTMNACAEYISATAKSELVAPTRWLSIENQPALLCEYTTKGERLGISAYLVNISLLTAVGDQALVILCSSSSLDKDGSQLASQALRLRPLCTAVMNTLVLPETYSSSSVQKWQSYPFANAGFSASFPSAPEVNPLPVDEGSITAYQVTDPVSGDVRYSIFVGRTANGVFDVESMDAWLKGKIEGGGFNSEVHRVAGFRAVLRSAF